MVNGEIYDFDDLRRDLAERLGYKFQTRSDSEVMLALYQHYGTPAFLEHLRGEFALCIYDERKRIFIAARDRYGIKPLFWTQSNGRLLVGAEVKAFLGLGWEAQWDVASLVEGGWNFDDRTLFKDVRKVKPGEYLTCELDSGRIETHSYWDIEYPDKVGHLYYLARARLTCSKTKVESRSEEEMIEGVRERLVDAIRCRLRADVPVGIYLSGGIDSSAIAGIANHLIRTRGQTMGSNENSQPITCFSIAFDEGSGLNEAGMTSP